MAKKRFFNPQWALEVLHVDVDLRERLQQEAEEFSRKDRRRKARQERAFMNRATARGKAALARNTEVSAVNNVAEAPSWTHVVAWQFSELARLEADLDGRIADRDFLVRVRKAVQLMRKVGPWRRLVTLPPDWRVRIDNLRTRFPNFGEVLEYVAAACAVAEQRDNVVRFGHILMSGPPGIGKSLFVEAMAQAFGLPWHRIDMASAQSSARLAGSDEYWSNTKPGLLFELLAFGANSAAANTVVVLDELEKSSSYGTHDPVGALYSLLEPASARNFADLSFPSIVLDASSMLFIGTVNEPERVPEPIRSRMRHFEVAPPNAEQSRKIIERIYAEAAAEFKAPTDGLSTQVVELLVPFPPRRVRQLLTEAFGRALNAGRTALEVDDVPAAKADAEVPRPKNAPIVLINLYTRDPDDEHSARVLH